MGVGLSHLSDRRILEAHRQHSSKAEAARSLGMPVTTFKDRLSRISEAPDRVLVIGDPHCPAMHPAYPDFLEAIYEAHECTRVVLIGDLVDWAAASFHAKEVGMPNIVQEWEDAKRQIKELTTRFPVCDYLLGNHDVLPARQLAAIGLPETMLRSYHDLLDLPEGWTVHERLSTLVIDGVAYQHGEKGSVSGVNSAFLNAGAQWRSCVGGHIHTQFGVVWGANEVGRYFGMQVGVGVDPRSPHMKYNRKWAKRPILGCGVVLEGKRAFAEPMFLEEWTR